MITDGPRITHIITDERILTDEPIITDEPMLMKKYVEHLFNLQ